MDLGIRPDRARPLHAQLAGQLKALIEAGGLTPGQRLPALRGLAATLALNYNTVRSVYLELERDGYVTSDQGRGTFVAQRPPQLPAGGRELLADRIDDALLAAAALGVPADMLARAFCLRSRALSGRPGAPARILFAECNRPDLEFHAREIAHGTGVAPETLLLAEAAARPPAHFAGYDAIATPLVHVAELQAAVGAGRRVLGLLVTPSPGAVLEELAQARPGTAVGLVCVSRARARGMRRALAGAGIRHLHLMAAGMDEPERLRGVLRAAAVVYLSRMGLHALDAGGGPWPRGAARGPEIRPYVTELDRTSLQMLRRAAAARTDPPARQAQV